jgi:hypothetical protein
VVQNQMMGRLMEREEESEYEYASDIDNEGGD